MSKIFIKLPLLMLILLFQESRQCNLERLSWCLDRLSTIKRYLDQHPDNNESADDFFGATTMHFVNWIDHAFANLKRLSDVVYRKDTDDVWKTEVRNHLYLLVSPCGLLK